MVATSIKWKIEGDYFEGCNCDSICPCIFKGDPDEGYCNITAAWHIQKGTFDNNVNLDGLNVVALFHTQGNMITGPKWSAVLYVDDRASKEQNDSLVKIYSGQAGGFFAALTNLIGKMIGVKSIPIEFGIDGKHRLLQINNLLNLQISGTEGADPNQESVIMNPAFSAVPGSNLVIAQSSKYSYNDHGMQWDISGKNGFYCKFKYSS